VTNIAIGFITNSSTAARPPVILIGSRLSGWHGGAIAKGKFRLGLGELKRARLQPRLILEIAPEPQVKPYSGD